ncbi:MAG: hypothetical protein GY716_13345 [bacterium]|nr:hypothetical protein [bacterium]
MTRAIALALTFALSMAGAATAGTRTWTASPEFLARGKSDGVAVSSRGRLFLAPELTRMDDEEAPAPPMQIWSMAVDEQGDLYLGTGPDGHVLRVGPTGARELLFTVDEPLVTAMTILPDGDLIAAGAPGGSIYRIGPDGAGELWAEPDERYVWTLTNGPQGTVFAGTGEQGTVLRIAASGRTEVFFDSDEAHIVSLIALPDGGLLAGGAGRGLVYQIDGEGNGAALYDDELAEATALSAAADGNVYAALVAPPPAEQRHPAVRLRLPDGVRVGAAQDGVGAFDDAGRPVLRGVIEGLRGDERPGDRAVRGRLVRIDADGRSTVLWESTSESPFCLTDRGNDVLMGTGEPARLYRVEDGDDDVSLLASLPQGQLTALLETGKGVVLGTSNPGAVYRMRGGRPDVGVFVSPPIDAGAPARWGSIRWDMVQNDGRTEIYTRTGNSLEPDGTWSGWGPALFLPSGSNIDNPDGRFLQWRARFVGPRNDAVVEAPAVRYAPYNRPPVMRDLLLDAPHDAVDGDARLEWSVFDADHDPVDVLLEYRARSANGWTPTSETAHSEEDDDERLYRWRDGSLTWDTSGLDEGRYEIRASISDERANAPGEGHRVSVAETLRLTVDRTPPEVEARATTGGGVELAVSDAHSGVRRVELVDHELRVHALRPIDGVCDSASETFRLAGEQAARGDTIRAVDFAGNTIEVELPRR